MRIRTHGFTQKEYFTQSFLLDFESKYYETFWFWILMSFLLFSLLFVSYKIGNYFNRKRKIELEIKIKEKTAILNESMVLLENSKQVVVKALQEKDTLLKEVHHRVKNNLQ